ncbi:MAG: periplasmic heavy metal sensor [Flavobacteriales bacterium]|nr:periplasmic heavy metal sensor [Flavobacteriales bacterium]
MNKIRILYVLVFICLAGNLFMAWQLTRHSGPPPRREPKELIIERLKLDQDQIKQYEQLIDQHRSAIHDAEKSLHEVKNKLYATLNAVDEVTSDSLLQSISLIQQNIEKIHYLHFRDIRNICKPEQIPAYEDLTLELSSLFGPPQKPRHPNQP